MIKIHSSLCRDVILYHDHIAEPILHEVICKSDNPHDVCVTFGNDLSVLLNQKRLDSLGHDSAMKMIEYLNTYHSDSMSEIKKNLSDDDLFRFVKSRNYQSLGDLKSWSHYLMSNFGVELEQYHKRVSDKNRELQEQQKLEHEASIKRYLDEHPEYVRK